MSAWENPARLTGEEIEVIKLAVAGFIERPVSNATEARRQTVAKQILRRDFEVRIICRECGENAEGDDW